MKSVVRTRNTIIVGRSWACAHVGEVLETLSTWLCCPWWCRGRSPKTLEGLRKRIAGLFLTCCQHPAFNPEAARLRVNAVGPNGPEAFEYVLEQQAAA